MSPERPSLDAIRLKLDRADEHRHALEVEYGKYIADQPHTALHEIQERRNVDLIRFLIRKEPPARLSILFGDAVHQVRSALDHLACVAVEAAGGMVTNSTAFPIADTEQGWIAGVECPREACGQKVSGPLKGIDPRSDVWALFKQAQPYQDGPRAKDHLLHGLEEFWNRDKHRALNPTWLYPDPNTLLDIFTWDPPIRPLQRRATFTRGKPLYHGAVIAMFEFPPGPMPCVSAQHPMSLALAFGDADVERGDFADTVALVRRLVTDVEALI